MSLLKLYYQMGKNESYQELFKSNYPAIAQRIAASEAIAFYKAFFSGYKLPESRLKTLQLSSTTPNNKGEVLYKNILSVFSMIHQPEGEKFHLNVTEIHDLVRLLFHDVYPQDKLQYRKLERQKHSLISTESFSMREQLEELIGKFMDIKKQSLYEPMFLHLNFMVDFMNMEIFKIPNNDVLAILIFYILTIQEGLIVSNYLSFFQKLLLNRQEYQTVLDKTRFGWSEGFSEIMPLTRYIIGLFQRLYIDFQEFARDYEYEAKLEISKSDYIENTIDKLSDVFQKEDIRIRHPFVSDSTINRTLKRLQEENKIRPLGKGRSAKWIKLYQKETKKITPMQLNLNLEES
jgi:phage pi2 protein 07